MADQNSPDSVLRQIPIAGRIESLPRCPCRNLLTSLAAPGRSGESAFDRVCLILSLLLCVESSFLAQIPAALLICILERHPFLTGKSGRLLQKYVVSTIDVSLGSDRMAPICDCHCEWTWRMDGSRRRRGMQCVRKACVPSRSTSERRCRPTSGERGHIL